jgi:putative transposase
MSRICCTSVASKSATKRFSSGGADLARCLQPRSGEIAPVGCAHTPTGSGIYLDEVFAKINGETHSLWRAVDHEGEVLESFVAKRRDRKVALEFLRKTMKRYGNPQTIVTDNLHSYGVAMKVIGNADGQQTGRWLNNRAENSRLPFRRRERAMLQFRRMCMRMRSLEKFGSVRASVSNHFNHERSLSNRNIFKHNLAAAIIEWRGLCAG